MSHPRRSVPLVAMASIVAALLTGCSGGTDDAAGDSATTTVSSAYGDVSVPTDPRRVAAVSYDTPWQLMSLDVRPVATIDYSQWADSYTAEQLDYIADAAPVGTFGEVNYEALAATTPDLIIGDAYEIDEAAYERLSDIAPTVIVGGGERGDWQGITEQTAAAVGRTDEWQAEKAAYEQLRDSTKEQYRDVIEGNTWINFSIGDDAGQFSVQLPTGSTGDLVVDEMGLTYGPGVPLGDPDNYGYVSLPLEQLPQVFDGVTVALTFSNQDGTLFPGVDTIADSPLFQSLPVAADGRVYGLFTTVTDYRSAQTWIEELATTVLEPLSA